MGTQTGKRIVKIQCSIHANAGLSEAPRCQEAAGRASLGKRISRGGLEDSGAGRTFWTEGAPSTDMGQAQSSQALGGIWFDLGTKDEAGRWLGPVMRGFSGAWAFNRALALCSGELLGAGARR